MRPATLPETLRLALRDAAPGLLCVAYSGGPDSSALLHALSRLPEARRCGLRALHVDHGLHPESAGWTERCVRFCASIDVPLTAVRVSVDDLRHEGIEAAARRARYAAFAGQIRDGEWLALAHHREDQIETVLLKLLRGAGPEGLGGMRRLRPFARGFLWRPLLDTTRDALHKYLISNEIDSIEDPANADPRFARNVLRREVVPLLARHWPHAGASILHAAGLCRTAADHLARQAGSTLGMLRRDDRTLDADGWLALPDALRAPVLDGWLRAQGLPAPPDASREELVRQAAHAAEDRVPLVVWPEAEVRIWDGRLHAMPPLAPAPDAWQSPWDGASLALPHGCGALASAATTGKASRSGGPRFDPPLTVRFRRGGERIKPAGDPHTRELRDLFQRARMAPWWRSRCPLVYARDRLIAVADLWTSEYGEQVFAQHAIRPRWLHPWSARHVPSSTA